MLGLPLDTVVEGLMSNVLNEGSIYKFRVCYGVTVKYVLRRNHADVDFHYACFKYIEETDDEQIKSDNDVQEMADAAKTNAEKAEKEKADEEQKENEQAMDKQANYDQVGALVYVTHKEKPELLLSTSSHSLSSNYGNQFLNVSSDSSLVGIIKEPTNTEINSLLDAQIQQTKVDHSEAIEASVQANLINEVKNQLPKPTAGSDQGKKKKRKGKDSDPPKDYQASSSKKGKPLAKTSKDDKPVDANENITEHIQERMLFQGIISSRTPIPQLETLDPEWTKDPSTDDAPEQTWFNNMVDVLKEPRTFDELMSTPLDFFKFATNRRKLDKLTKESRAGLQASQRHMQNVVSVKIDKQYGYGYLEEIVVRIADRKLYTFKEGDFPNLHLNDIKDMLLLCAHNKIFNLEGDDLVDLVMALRMFTRSIVMKVRIEDVQLGVKSYQKKLNLTRP
ncbi:hypothetical protein Tco_1401857 [Tanacetum coccineum]